MANHLLSHSYNKVLIPVFLLPSKDESSCWSTYLVHTFSSNSTLAIIIGNFYIYKDYISQRTSIISELLLPQYSSSVLHSYSHNVVLQKKQNFSSSEIFNSGILSWLQSPVHFLISYSSHTCSRTMQNWIPLNPLYFPNLSTLKWHDFLFYPIYIPQCIP